MNKSDLFSKESKESKEARKAKKRIQNRASAQRSRERTATDTPGRLKQFNTMFEEILDHLPPSSDSSEPRSVEVSLTLGSEYSNIQRKSIAPKMFTLSFPGEGGDTPSTEAPRNIGHGVSPQMHHREPAYDDTQDADGETEVDEDYE